jgi:hypothetical protein
MTRSLTALFDHLDEAVGLQRLQVVVDLLPGQADLGGQHGGGGRLAQLGQQPGPDGVQRDLGGGRVLDHCDILHATKIATDKLFCQDSPVFRCGQTGSSAISGFG